MKLLPFLVLVAFSLIVRETVSLKARAWQNKLQFSSGFSFPEFSSYNVGNEVALMFTGGGSRSFQASFGYMAGLADLGLMEKVDLMGGISGGSWATMVYVYGKRSDEKIWLGPIIQPEDITEEKLNVMDPNCARKLTDSAFTTIAMKDVLHASNLGEMWAYATQEVYLSPVGIQKGAYWAWNQQHVDEIVKENPELANAEFLLPEAPDAPFPLVGATLVGPQNGAPYTFKRANQNYTFFEMTPLYSGHAKTLQMEYNTNKKHSNDVQRRTVGGFIETFAFNRKSNTTDGTNIAPEVGLGDEETAILDIPKPAGVFDISYAAGASSFAPGAFFDSFKIEKPTSLHFNYYSPTNPAESTEGKGNRYDTLFADGGSYENIPLISYVQRRTKRIIYCSNSMTQLQPSSKWDVDAPDGPQQTDMIDSSIPAFFGIVLPADHTFQDRSYEYDKNQIFATGDYATVIKGLQAAQAAGKGIFYRTTLKTVQNDWWGIEAGLEVDITFAILGRLSQWEALLNDDMHKLLVPQRESDEEDLAKTVKKGHFKHFPAFATSGADLDYKKANALASLTAWSVQQNKELFEDIFS